MGRFIYRTTGSVLSITVNLVITRATGSTKLGAVGSLAVGIVFYIGEKTYDEVGNFLNEIETTPGLLESGTTGLPIDFIERFGSNGSGW